MADRTEAQKRRTAQLIEASRRAGKASIEARVAKVEAYLVANGPTSVADLAANLYMSDSSVKDSLRRLRGTHKTDTRERTVRVVKWAEKPDHAHVRYIPLYGPGTIKDAKAPKFGDVEYGRRYRAKYRALVKMKSRKRAGATLSMWDQLLTAAQ